MTVYIGNRNFTLIPALFLLTALAGSAGTPIFSTTLSGFDEPVSHAYLETYMGSGVYGTDLTQMPTNVYENSNYARDLVFVPVAECLKSEGMFFLVQ